MVELESVAFIGAMLDAGYWMLVEDPVSSIQHPVSARSTNDLQQPV
jgi:hypothetical protein